MIKYFGDLIVPLIFDYYRSIQLSGYFVFLGEIKFSGKKLWKEKLGYLMSKMKEKICDIPKAWSEYGELYRKWSDMFKRCYSDNWLEKHPSYVGCEVCEGWFLFSNFKNWCEQFNYNGMCLDKDLFGDGKLYSPETCCFLYPEVNKFLTNRSTGITQKDNVDGYIVQVCTDGKKGKHFSKIVKTIDEAKSLYLAKKLERVNLLVSRYSLSNEIRLALVNWVNSKFRTP